MAGRLVESGLLTVPRLGLSPAGSDPLAAGLLHSSRTSLRARLWPRGPRAPSLRSTARPQPAGKASKLSCVEAVAATLVIVGLRGRAEQLLTKFKWGPTFLFLNRELFTAYGRCANSAEVVLAQNECIARWESER